MPSKSLAELEELVGTSVRTVEDLAVEAGKVDELARTLRNEDPIHRDTDAAQERGYEAIPAPLIFTRLAYFERHRPDGIGNDLGFDLGFDQDNVLHGEQEYEFERPVIVGEVLTGTTTLVDVSQKEGGRGGTMTFAVYETEYRDQNGDLVVTERITRIETTGGDE
jgi:peroxisomal enoyl-CoA hydratase 2